MRVPIVKLDLDQEILEKVSEVLKSGMWIEGKNVRALEREFAGYIGVKHARAVNSGTAALLCSLKAIGIQNGDEVLVPSFTFMASVNTILNFGAKPVFVDICRDTFNIDIKDLEKHVSEKTKAIMPVHLYGLPVEMKAVKKIADEHGLFVIEDACQAHGAEYEGKKCGSLGDVGAFSFYPTKNMFCGGEGGIITTNSDDFLEKANLYANHGQTEKYMHSDIGFNYRLQDSNGLIARYSLEKLDDNNNKRRENAKFYNEELADIEHVETPIEPKNCKHVYHQYTLKVEKRDKLAEYLRSNEIGFGIHYKIPAHLQESIISRGLSRKLPVTEKLASEVISLPVHPSLTREQLQHVVDTIKQFYK
ncbi:MAG: DegT/DnrJ/EryC1/StrS family aminotransferase [Promethearchaeota archaeon]